MASKKHQDLYSGPITYIDSDQGRIDYITSRGYERLTQGSKGDGGHRVYVHQELLDKAESLAGYFVTEKEFEELKGKGQSTEHCVVRPRNFARITLPTSCSLGVWDGSVRQLRNDIKLIEEAEQKKAEAGAGNTDVSLDDKRKFLLDNDFIPLEQRGGTSQVWTHPILQELMGKIPQGMRPQQPNEHGKHGEVFTIMLSVLDAANAENAQVLAKNWEQIKERVKWCKQKAVQLDRILKLTEQMEEMKMDICIKKKEASWKHNLGSLFKQDPQKAMSCAAEFRQKAERAIKAQVVLSGAVRSAQRTLRNLSRDFTS